MRALTSKACQGLLFALFENIVLGLSYLIICYPGNLEKVKAHQVPLVPSVIKQHYNGLKRIVPAWMWYFYSESQRLLQQVMFSILWFQR